MKYISLILILFLFGLSGCEDYKQVECFPQRITTTIAQGTNASAITADYKYDGDLIDHIIWSNFQTHYYSYDESSRLVMIRKMNVQTYKKIEERLSYENGLLKRKDIYEMSLDRFTQEDADTLFIGYHVYSNSGSNIILEEIYTLEEGLTSLTSSKEYSYDALGNISKTIVIEAASGDTLEAYTYSYDAQHHMFSSLSLPFEGESYVNNIVAAYDLQSDDVYTHQVLYTPSSFPEQINIKIGSYLNEVIRIDYTCK